MPTASILRTLRLPSLTIEHPMERIAMRLLLVAVGLLVCAYVYLIASSTFNIIARKQAENAATSVSSDLAQLNAEYYQLGSQVTPAKANQLGLVALADRDYVTRTSRLTYAAPLR